MQGRWAQALDSFESYLLHTGMAYALKRLPVPNAISYIQQGLHTGDGVTVRNAVIVNHQYIDRILHSELASRGKTKK